MISEDIKKLYEIIKEEIIPKYDCVEDCTMIELSDMMFEDVEFLFKVNENMDPDYFSAMPYLLRNDLNPIYQKLVGEKTSFDLFILVVSRY